MHNAKGFHRVNCLASREDRLAVTSGGIVRAKQGNLQAVPSPYGLPTAQQAVNESPQIEDAGNPHAGLALGTPCDCQTEAKGGGHSTRSDRPAPGAIGARRRSPGSPCTCAAPAIRARTSRHSRFPAWGTTLGGKARELGGRIELQP